MAACIGKLHGRVSIWKNFSALICQSTWCFLYLRMLVAMHILKTLPFLKNCVASTKPFKWNMNGFMWRCVGNSTLLWLQNLCFWFHVRHFIIRSCYSEVFCKKAVVRNFRKLTEKQLRLTTLFSKHIAIQKKTCERQNT